jgi:hypothetical protein
MLFSEASIGKSKLRIVARTLRATRRTGRDVDVARQGRRATVSDHKSKNRRADATL